MKLALVPIPDDATDTAINLSYWRGSDYHAEWVPVPEDDQLRDDLEAAVAACGHLARDGHDDWLEWRAIAERLRAWAGLDQEES